MEAKRHTCIVCKKKRAEYKMKLFRSSWACRLCLSNGAVDPGSAADLGKDQGNEAGIVPVGSIPLVKVLNLYAGIGGNRKLWPKTFKVTAVEHNPKIAAAYKSLYPEDAVIVGDAHNYLLKNFYKFDLVWSSPPCQSHSRMNYTFGNVRRRYVDMSLYQQILLLREFFKGHWVIENVKPYYEPMIPADYEIGRHLFWSDCRLNDQVELPQLRGSFIDFKSPDDKKVMQDWLGITVNHNLYSTGKNYLQVYRNCVHPLLGLSIINDIINSN